MDKLLFSKKEAAELLGISLRTVENLITRKELTSRRIGRRRMIPASTLAQFVRRDTPLISGKGGAHGD
jgi:excisionase family DNA binding protein